MKKTFLMVLVAMSVATSAYGQRKYEVRQEKGLEVLFIHDQKFLGKREEVMSIDTFDITQPENPELLLLPLTTGSGRNRDIYAYQLFRFMEGQWEHVADFRGDFLGDSEPKVVLRGDVFTVTQSCCEPEYVYHYEIISPPHAGTRYWVLKEVRKE